VTVLLAAALSGCLSPQMSLLFGLIPDGTFTTLLSNMRGVDEPNRDKLVALEKKGDWNGIAQFADANIKIDPHNVDWWVISGYAYAQLAQYEKAAEHFKEAVHLSPDDVTAWNLLAQAYRSLGRPEQAIRTLDTALQVDRDSPFIAVTYYLLGECYNDLKRPERAVTYYEQAVKRDGEFVAAVYQLGLTYATLGRQNEFDACVRQLQRIDPEAARRLAAVPVAAR